MSGVEETKKKLETVGKALDDMGVPDFIKTSALMITALGGNPTEFIVNAMSSIETKKAENKNPRSELEGDYDELERIIIDMLTENTGVHLLDSGFVYGRHWERNRKVKNWNETPVLYIDLDPECNEINVTLNIYHYLRVVLNINDLSRELDKRLQEFIDDPDNVDKSYLDIMEEFADMIAEEYGFNVSKIWNSYNWDNLLSQVLQGITLYRDDDESEYWILQIHNGCDVRGGYTRPRVFHVPDPYLAMDAMTDINAYCQCTSVYSDDCGYHWYGDEIEGFPTFWKIIDKNTIRCEKCGDNVKIYSPIEDYL